MHGVSVNIVRYIPGVGEGDVVCVMIPSLSAVVCITALKFACSVCRSRLHCTAKPLPGFILIPCYFAVLCCVGSFETTNNYKYANERL